MEEQPQQKRAKSLSLLKGWVYLDDLLYGVLSERLSQSRAAARPGFCDEQAGPCFKDASLRKRARVRAHSVGPRTFRESLAEYMTTFSQYRQGPRQADDDRSGARIPGTCRGGLDLLASPTSIRCDDDHILDLRES
jgi:hypothetical protein